MKTSSLLIPLLLICNVFNQAVALETDQFIAGNVTLKDSSDVMNEYFINYQKKALEWANKKGLSASQCSDVAVKSMSLAVGKFDLSAASTYASATPLIERFPEDSVSERGYKDQSFYEHAWIPLQVIDLARTINVNDIYVGTDKFGHFSHMGLRYYKKYLSLRKKGIEKQEAIKKAIVNGFKTEYSILGYGIDGVMSYADLEANYQGFMYMLQTCESQNPYFVFQNNQWILNPERKLDVREYFTPKMDEAYNFSFWRKPLYKRVKQKLVSEYCQMKDDPIFQERMKSYAERDKENLNDELIREHISNQPRFLRAHEDLKSECEKLNSGN